MKLLKYIANLGYGSRKEVARIFREGRITNDEGEVLYADDHVQHTAVRFDGEPLDPPPGLMVMLHKPSGYICSTKDAGRLVYDLLPARFRLRSRCFPRSVGLMGIPVVCCYSRMMVHCCTG